MKKIIFRKLLTDYLSFFLIALLSTSIIIWVFQAVNFLDIMIEDGRDYLIYIKYSLLNFPKTFSKLFSFILFFSLFYVTTKYENNNEMIIFWNFGVNKIQIINFIFKLSIFLLFVQIVLASVVVPKSQDLARSYLRTSNVNFVGNFIKPQRFNDTIKGVTIYSDRKDSNGNLYNLYLKKGVQSDNFQITYAKKGIFKEINNIPILILFDGETITGKNNKLTNLSFAKSDFSLDNFQSNTSTYKKTQEVSTIKILKCIDKIYDLKFYNINKKQTVIENCNYQNIKNILKEFYKRLIIPLYIPILTMIPFLLIISSKENLNYNIIKGLTFLLGLIVIIFSETTIRFISDKMFQNLIIVTFPLILFLTIYFIFWTKFKLIKTHR